ncbi:acetyl-CoA sensor PanZ family protein [Halomonas piscis]|uniref:acetyl-CoA sensor PanZ family protein n=1 Tax=Halomonas piscis TaxID=3031727 RepID=UPI0028A14431|nr:acetyl-CoA sensor PanZ family protein [Halomonas piscis]
MPVTLQHVDQTRWAQDPQARHDLIRIYRDADPACLAPEAAEAFVAEHLRAGNGFACALFNARLLGAVAVTSTADGTWQLSHLCVRAETRGRGVATRLLALVAADARNRAHRRLGVASPTSAEGALYARLGHEVDGDGRVLTGTPEEAP